MITSEWVSVVVNNYWMRFLWYLARIIKVEVGVISRSRRLRLITLTETLIILGITKTEYNYCFIIHWTKQKKNNSCLCFFTDGKKNKASELDMITLRNHAPRLYTTWLPVTLTWLLNNLQLWRHRRGFRKLTVCFRPIRKEIVSSMYNNYNNCAAVLREFPIYNIKVPVGLIFVNLKSEITLSYFTQRSNFGEFSKWKKGGGEW